MEKFKTDYLGKIGIKYEVLYKKPQTVTVSIENK